MPRVSSPHEAPPPAAGSRAELGEIAREWGRLGCVGFGGPPAHVALLRELCVERRGWLSAREFEDRKSTRLNSSHIQKSRMPSSA